MATSTRLSGSDESRPQLNFKRKHSTDEEEQVITSSSSSIITDKNNFDDFCPSCQMPFNILHVQSRNWHLEECLVVDRSCQRGKIVGLSMILHF